MDDFIRRQFTWRKIQNPLLKTQRVWRSVSPGDSTRPNSTAGQRDDDDDASSLHELEQVDETLLLGWQDITVQQRLYVLHCLCEWHLHSDKFRERAGVSTEREMAYWRIDPIGRDSRNMLYYYLDDHRLYRGVDYFRPAPKAKAQRKSIADSASKKRKRSTKAEEEAAKATAFDEANTRDDWKCLATNFEEFSAFVDTLPSPRNDEESELFTYMREELLPPMQQAEEKRRAKAEREELERIKEMQRLELVANRKRSSRIMAKEEQKAEDEARGAEERRIRILEERARQQALEEERERLRHEKMLSRYVAQPVPRATREARMRERELREYVQDRDSKQSTPGPSSTFGDALTSTAGDVPASTDRHENGGDAIANGIDSHAQAPTSNDGVAKDHVPAAQQLDVPAQDAHWVNEKAMEQAPVTNGQYKQDLVSTSQPSKPVASSSTAQLPGERPAVPAGAPEPKSAADTWTRQAPTAPSLAATTQAALATAAQPAIEPVRPTVVAAQALPISIAKQDQPFAPPPTPMTRPGGAAPAGLAPQQPTTSASAPPSTSDTPMADADETGVPAVASRQQAQSSGAKDNS